MSPWSYMPVTIEARNDLPGPVALPAPVSRQLRAAQEREVDYRSGAGRDTASPARRPPSALRALRALAPSWSSDNPTTYVARQAVLVSGPVIRNTE